MTSPALFKNPVPEVPAVLLDALRLARRVVVFSGAGMSAESGIPIFRDAMHGLWAQFSPHELATPEGWEADPARVWAWYEWRRGLVMRAAPHAGHMALGQLASALSRFAGHDVVVDAVTQNVDDLHERAGVKGVQHLHGSLFAPRCSACGQPAEFAGVPPVEPVASLVPPRCKHCQGFIRPGVVWFGESLPQDAWQRTEALMAQCDVLLVVGTSGVVYPAAGLPAAARQAGKWVAEINPTASELSSHIHLHWQTTAAQGLGSLLQALTTRGTA
ncbi:NAD-dependent deacetylase [Polaromonas sp. CG_9.5]|uniref:SIR2 family NAD-dependent protein deacylase n=1 Tax=Polaromonas sp. CG_9.5 TaxID=3071705 RepID=UPI002DFE36BB|nr:NAD-dependent deacetylase [Polaromonas sp. CG_9.5]